MKPRFLLDVDQVLTPFVDRLLPIIQGVLGRPWHWSELPNTEWNMFSVLTPWQLKAVEAIMAQPGFCSTFQADPNAWHAVCELHKLCEVFAVTAPAKGAHWIPERTLWLQDKFTIPSDRIIYTEAKSVISGDFFLDDHPHNVTAWAQEHPNGVPMLWTTDHNRRLRGPADEYRVEGWANVLSIVTSHVVRHTCS